MQNKVCIYAICKNEEQFVDKWVDSMQEADSIVVLDTGSTDHTVEKLRARGVTVKTQIFNPWRFDTPRNVAMEMAPEDCNILMSTDLDELLEPGWADILRERWIEGKHTRASYKYVWSHMPDGSPGRVFGYNKIHNRDWIWKYPVHELLWSTKTCSELYELDESLNLFNEITLHHYPDPEKSRSNYLPLLELRKAENDKDWYGRIYLAHEYYYRGFYEKAIQELNDILTKYKENYSSLEEASCYLFRGDAFKALKEYSKAIDSYLEAIKIEPTYRETYLDLAQLYMDLGQNLQARFYLKEALVKSYRHYTWLERDTSWSYELYDKLALACFYSGYKMESIAYAAKAAACAPSDERLKNNLKLCIERTSDEELNGK